MNTLLRISLNPSIYCINSGHINYFEYMMIKEREREKKEEGDDWKKVDKSGRKMRIKRQRKEEGNDWKKKVDK